MHARRAFAWPAIAPSRKGFRHALTIVWATCLVVGLLMLATFGYGMWRGVADEDHLNQVWRQEGIAGGVFEGNIRVRNGLVYPSITGSAFVNTEATLILDERDRFCWGIR